MSATTTLEPPQTLAELVERLDGVPTERIRFLPMPGTATEDDVVALAEQADKVLCELVSGTLVEKAVSWDESDIAGEFLYWIKHFVREHGLGGKAVPGDGAHRMSAGNVRYPDVSYTTADRVPPPGERGKIARWAPDLAVEVLSASNTKREMDRKLREYFASGVRLVWYVDPPSRTIRVFTSPEDVVELGDDDTLDGGNVLPGFSLSVRELFDGV